MGTGYTRADTANNIADGNIINASDLDSEYDAIQSAFNASTGHTHDGTAGEGAPIETIGPSQDVVATASVLRPKTDNTVDLGTTSLEYKDLFLDGTAHIDTLDVDENASITGTLGVTGTTTLGTANITTGTITTADINGGNIDGTIIGATTAAAITGTTITGTSFVTSGDMTFGDNDKAIFGAGSDLEIYSTGANGFIENNTGLLILKNNSDDRDIALQSDDGSGGVSNYLLADGSTGSLKAYHYGDEKLATTSTGIDVTGDATFADNGKAIFGAGSDLQIYHSGTHSFIEDKGTGNLYIDGSSAVIIRGDTASTISATFNDAGAVTLRNNGDTKLATTSTGIDVTGTVTADGLTVDGNTLHVDATNNRVGIGTTSPENDLTISSTSPQIRLSDTNAAGTPYSKISGASGNIYIQADEANETANSKIDFRVDGLQRAVIDSNGNISFYEDTGTTAKFFWDASAESLGIGTSSPDHLLSLEGDAPVLRIFDASNVLNQEQTIKFGTEPGNRTHAEISGVNLNTGNAEGALTFKVNSGASLSERMRIDSSGNVGIGNTSSGYAFTSGETRLAVGDGSEHAAIQIYSGTAKWGGLEFADDATNGTGQGFIGYYHPSDYMQFNTSGSERMRILSAGSLLVGKSVTTFNTTGMQIDGPNGNFSITASGATTAFFNRTSTDGNIAEFYKDGATVGSIASRGGTTTSYITFPTSGSGAGIGGSTNMVIPVSETGAAKDAGVNLGSNSTRWKDLYLSGAITAGANSGVLKEIGSDLSITQGAIGLRINDAASALSPTTASANNDNAVDLGVSNIRFKDLYLSGGVYLGGTGSGNKLDEYEEGDYIASLTCATSGTITLSSATNSLRYTRIGRLVHVQGQLGVASVSSPNGELRVSLPFTVANLGDAQERGVGTAALQGIAYTGDYVVVTTSTADVSYAGFLQVSSGAGWIGLPSDGIVAGDDIRFGFTFYTND